MSNEKGFKRKLDPKFIWAGRQGHEISRKIDDLRAKLEYSIIN